MVNRRSICGAVVAMALLASACGSAESPVESAAQPPATVAADVLTTTTTTEAPSLPPGRTALAAAVDAGEPHIVWFWGAN